jgi:hypothetical protein
MNKNLFIVGILLVMSSCGKYSQVVDQPKKDEKEANTRIFGEVDGPAKQSKITYPTPPDAADKSVKIHAKMFGKENKPAAENAGTVSAPASAAPADTSAVSK